MAEEIFIACEVCKGVALPAKDIFGKPASCYECDGAGKKSLDIPARIEAIRSDLEEFGDPAAHIAEDTLYRDFIRYISTLDTVPPELAAMAKMILTTKEIEFYRWYS